MHSEWRAADRADSDPSALSTSHTVIDHGTLPGAIGIITTAPGEEAQVDYGEGPMVRHPSMAGFEVSTEALRPVDARNDGRLRTARRGYQVSHAHWQRSRRAFAGHDSVVACGTTCSSFVRIVRLNERAAPQPILARQPPFKSMARITVVFATYNGIRTLPRMLQSLAEMDPPSGGWKLVVVDNGSTDGSGVLLAQFVDSLPLTVLLEKRRGKNIALNAALDQISGDLVVLTDDDILVPRGWLRGFETMADSLHEFTVFGGRIAPLWPQAEPADVIRAVPLGPAYAAHPAGVSEGPSVSDMMWGGNLAVRAEVFSAGLRFSTSVGPSKGQYVMGGETDFVRRVEGLGHRCWFTETATVQHIIRPEQLTASWIASRAERFGKFVGSEQYSRNSSGRRGTRFRNGAGWCKRLLVGRLRMLAGAIGENEVLRLSGVWQSHMAIGALSQWTRLTVRAASLRTTSHALKCHSSAGLSARRLPRT